MPFFKNDNQRHRQPGLLSISLYFSALFIAGALFVLPCCSKSNNVSKSDSDDSPSEDTSGDTTDAATDGSDSGSVSPDDPIGDSSDPSPSDTGDTEKQFDECVAVEEGAENTREPADIIFVIDNSKSLSDEIQMVRENMNAFSQRIMNSGIDPHIVVVSCLPGECGARGGVSYGICIDPPLGAEDGCQYVSDTPDTDDPAEPVTPDTRLPAYKHLSVRVPSMKGLEWLVTTYEDDNGLTTEGWHDMLRTNATKHVVVVSDDGDQSEPDNFNAAFTALSPDLADYQFHGIFAYVPKDVATADDPCGIYAAPSSPDADPPIYWDTYSTLVEMTSGVSGNLCEQDFDPVFDALGTSVIASSKINCEWTIPDPPGDMTLDPSLVNVAFSSAVTNTYIVGNIPSATDCQAAPHGWYYDNNATPSKIMVCPTTCDWFQSEADAHLTIQFGCATQTVEVE